MTIYNEMADNEVPDSAVYPSTLTEEKIDTGATYEREAKQLIGLVTRLDRSQEEQRMIEAEATNVLSYFNEDITKAVEVIAVLNGQNQAHKGGIARLQMAVACCEIKRYKLIQQLGLSDNLEMRFDNKIELITQ